MGRISLVIVSLVAGVAVGACLNAWCTTYVSRSAVQYEVHSRSGYAEFWVRREQRQGRARVRGNEVLGSGFNAVVGNSSAASPANNPQIVCKGRELTRMRSVGHQITANIRIGE